MTEEELKKQLEKERKIYAEELKRKDKIIEELREQNTLVMKSALRQSDKINQLTDKLKNIPIRKKHK